MLRRLLPCLLLAVAALSQGSVAYYRSYGPRNVTRLSRPTVAWEVWPSEGAKVTSVEMRLNGNPVKARYDVEHRSLAYTPEAALSPGEYSVAAKVTVDEHLVVSRAWSFRVSTDTIARLEPPDAHQIKLLDEVNEFRSSLGLGPAHLDDRLNAAAVAHSSYLRRNHTSGHYEQPNDPGYTGNSPGDRMEAFGYFGSSYEDVCTGSKSSKEALQLLFDAPYHRIPFMSPGDVPIGGAYDNGCLTLQFGMSEAVKTVVSPAAGETGVATDWSQPEHPDPMRMHSHTGPVGYPIVFAAFGANEPIKVQSAKVITSDGHAVPLFLNSPENDDRLDNAAILIPKDPLAGSTTYRVEVRAQDGAGRDISRTWSFRTRAE